LDRKSLLKFGFITLLLVSSTVLSIGSIENFYEEDFSDLEYCDKEFCHENYIELHVCDQWQNEEKGSHYKDVLNLRSREKVEHQSVDDNYTPRDPIYINGNDDFHDKAEENNWFGDGTEQNPYIIEEYEICGRDTETGHPNYAVIIRNTDVHFEVRNNFLFGASHPNPGSSTSAVALTNVNNGVIRNNKMRSNSHGINLLVGSSYNEVLNNTLIDNDRAILINSNNNTIAGNNVTIEDGSPMFSLGGIYLRDSAEYNTLTRNRISKYYDTGGEGRGIYASELSNNNLIYHNIFIDNEVHALDHGDNIWNKPYPTGGNYWDNHTEPDEYSGPDQDEPGSDGFVDEPKEIKGEGDNVDKYPLTTPTPPKVEEEEDDDVLDRIRDIPGFTSLMLLPSVMIAVAIYRKKKE